jgi:hypothetical protein
MKVHFLFYIGILQSIAESGRVRPWFQTRWEIMKNSVNALRSSANRNVDLFGARCSQYPIFLPALNA